MIISLCCGVPITESQSKVLCLCLDKNKKSLSAGVLSKKNSPGPRGHSRTILAEFNYRQGTKKLLETLSKVTKKNLKVLLQHPSPSPAGIKDLSAACSDIMECLSTGIVSSICFVYDFDPKPEKNCWTKEALLSLCEIDQLDVSSCFVSDLKCISRKGDTQVNHPLFGMTERFGWARMKNSDEMTFSISSL